VGFPSDHGNLIQEFNRFVFQKISRPSQCRVNRHCFGDSKGVMVRPVRHIDTRFVKSVNRDGWDGQHNSVACFRLQASSTRSVKQSTQSISSHEPGETPGSRFFSFGWRKTPQSRPRFLVFPWIWALIHPTSPGHPRSPGARSGTPNERKAGTGPLYRRENTQTLQSGRKSPSPSPCCSVAAGSTSRQIGRPVA
jgi:hypothetical protein